MLNPSKVTHRPPGGHWMLMVIVLGPCTGVGGTYAITTKARSASFAPNANRAATRVTVQPFNRNELVLMRAMAAWINFKCSTLVSIATAALPLGELVAGRGGCGGRRGSRQAP